MERVVLLGGEEEEEEESEGLDGLAGHERMRTPRGLVLYIPEYCIRSLPASLPPSPFDRTSAAGPSARKTQTFSRPAAPLRTAAAG